MSNFHDWYQYYTLILSHVSTKRISFTIFAAVRFVSPYCSINSKQQFPIFSAKCHMRYEELRRKINELISTTDTGTPLEADPYFYHLPYQEPIELK